ncbi:MAG: hypothetical protein P1U61_07970 [Legionellaceae bacterium]|nr:hypothetical protein [Legionellaceae bacterium]
MNTHYIPSLTTTAGQVLTVADWTAAGVHTASCELTALLVKPGITTLRQLSSLKQYWDWPGKLLLNLSSIVFNTQGQCNIRSPFDGSTLKFSEEEILNLVEHLDPDYTIFSSFFMSLKSKHFESNAHDFKVNNQPSEDALEGVIYTTNKPFSICNASYTYDFSSLDDACQCPACKAGFTRAYFHHLYVHTPLLCHRWLVMHNQWMVHMLKV